MEGEQSLSPLSRLPRIGFSGNLNGKPYTPGANREQASEFSPLSRSLTCEGAQDSPALNSRNTHPSKSLTPAQHLLFWRVAAAGGQVLVKSIHPVPQPALRRALEHTGLVVQRQVLDSLTGRHASSLQITSRGWEWAQGNMDGPFANSPGSAETLSILLQSLSKFLERENLRLADLFAGSQSPTQSGGLEEPHTLCEEFEDRLDTPAEMIDASIVRQIVTLASGCADVAISLRSLRRLLDIHRIDLEASLRRLHRDGRIELMRTPNFHAMSEEDRQAVLFDDSGNPVHKVKLSRELEIAG